MKWTWKWGNFIWWYRIMRIIESLDHSLIWYSWILLVCVIWGVPFLVEVVVDILSICFGSMETSMGCIGWILQVLEFALSSDLKKPCSILYLFLLLTRLVCNMWADCSYSTHLGWQPQGTLLNSFPIGLIRNTSD